MKLWRKLAMRQGKQNGTRPGRSIKRQMMWEEQMFKQLPRSTPLLNALFDRVGLPVVKPRDFLEENQEQKQATAWGG